LFGPSAQAFLVLFTSTDTVQITYSSISADNLAVTDTLLDSPLSLTTHCSRRCPQLNAPDLFPISALLSCNKIYLLDRTQQRAHASHTIQFI
jgi:hypothetical protein